MTLLSRIEQTGEHHVRQGAMDLVARLGLEVISRVIDEVRDRLFAKVPKPKEGPRIVLHPWDELPNHDS